MGDVEEIAGAFVSARQAARGLSVYPGTIPQTLDDAYAVQDRAIALVGAPVAGWKVGRINAPLDAHFGTNRIAGPIFAPQVRSAAQSLAMPVIADGFAAAEAEFLLRIGTAPDPAKFSYTMDEAARLIDAVHVGIEIASSPFPGINDHGPTVTASDFGNNFGLVVGPSIGDWRDGAYLGWPIRLTIDGTQAGAACASEMLDGPVGAARFLFALMAQRGIALQPGQWISSGAVTGVHMVTPGAQVGATFGDEFAVGCTIEAATAHEDVLQKARHHGRGIG